MRLLAVTTLELLVAVAALELPGPGAPRGPEMGPGISKNEGNYGILMKILIFHENHHFLLKVLKTSEEASQV